MPTQTFFNLPQAKRAKLMQAIRAEYTTYAPEDVSINRIVHTAGISRGSFYQYFTGKQDMLAYLLSSYRHQAFDFTLESLQKHRGDLFAAFEDTLNFTFAFVTQEQHNAFFRNLLTDIRINKDLYAISDKEAGHRRFVDAIRSYTDMGMLNIQSAEDFDNMVSILLLITGETIADIFMDTGQYRQAKTRYHQRLALLKRGFGNAQAIHYTEESSWAKS